MTDEQKKALTLYLGEPWALLYNMRSFDTDADMMALFRKLVNSLNFGAFQNFAYKRFDDPRNYTLTEWLFYDPERFCCLVAEWIESNKTKKGGNK